MAKRLNSDFPDHFTVSKITLIFLIIFFVRILNKKKKIKEGLCLNYGNVIVIVLVVSALVSRYVHISRQCLSFY